MLANKIKTDLFAIVFQLFLLQQGQYHLWVYWLDIICTNHSLERV